MATPQQQLETQALEQGRGFSDFLRDRRQVLGQSTSAAGQQLQSLIGQPPQQLVEAGQQSAQNIQNILSPEFFSSADIAGAVEQASSFPQRRLGETLSNIERQIAIAQALQPQVQPTSAGFGFTGLEMFDSDAVQQAANVQAGISKIGDISQTDNLRGRTATILRLQGFDPAGGIKSTLRQLANLYYGDDPKEDIFGGTDISVGGGVIGQQLGQLSLLGAKAFNTPRGKRARAYDDIRGAQSVRLRELFKQNSQLNEREINDLLNQLPKSGDPFNVATQKFKNLFELIDVEFGSGFGIPTGLVPGLGGQIDVSPGQFAQIGTPGFQPQPQQQGFLPPGQLTPQAPLAPQVPQGIGRTGLGEAQFPQLTRGQLPARQQAELDEFDQLAEELF